MTSRIRHCVSALRLVVLLGHVSLQVDDPESLSPAERFRVHTSLRGFCPARQGMSWSFDRVSDSSFVPVFVHIVGLSNTCKPQCRTCMHRACMVRRSYPVV